MGDPVITAALLVTMTVQAAPADSGRQCATLPITGRHSLDSFTLLEDGQPSAPRQLEGQVVPQVSAGGSDRASPAFSAELAYTPGCAGFLRELQAAVGLSGSAEGAHSEITSVSATWLQRWLVRPGSGLTLSTVLTAGFPVRGAAERQVAITGALGKDLLHGVAGFNLSLLGAAGDVDEAGWRLGGSYRRWLGEDLMLALNAAGGRAPGASRGALVELGAAYSLTRSVSVGPGLQLWLAQGPDTPTVVFGVVVLAGDLF